MTPFSSSVSIDPDGILPKDIQAKFTAIVQKFDDVFSPHLTGYNGNAGPFEAHVNIGPVQPPQRKGRVPQYSRNQLTILQQHFNELEAQGVFRKPEDVGISVEYLNPSFLVKKSNGGFRLVTAFSDVGRYSKPQPSLLPDVDSILRRIADWKYIAVTDLTKAFFQIPLSRESMKYCGVVTPFRGVRVYTRAAMGMPGSETALEELTCRVLGDLLEEGVVTKLADDLYCGGDSPTALLHNWSRVLQALSDCGLKLSPAKTVIAPKCTTILGWIWECGSIRASHHRVAPIVSCKPPETVKGLRSFIGSVKVLARVIPNCAQLLSPLDDVTAGRISTDSIVWSDDLLAHFSKVQKAVASPSAIVLPNPQDQLWIVTDGAVRSPGLGATLYVNRNKKLLLAGFFSAKLRIHQTKWLPCEVEALSIAVAVKHYSPFIIQSSLTACVLTDSRPCVLAYEKLCRGEFSASPRVSTFLSVLSRYQANVRHVSGSALLPSDFASRNAPECVQPSCQICKFISDLEESVVRQVNLQDVLTGRSTLPFTSKAAWKTIQAECPDLRRTHAHLAQGTRPSKKLTNVKDVKRYLKVVTIAPDGLLVVKREEPFETSRSCIVVPRKIIHGLLTSYHIQLQHPTATQLKSVVRRFFFALDLDKAISEVSSSCHHCASIQKVPNELLTQSTTHPPEAVGVSFAADVVKRERQLIFLVRECVTSFTSACIIEDERHVTLRNALLSLCVPLRPLDGPPAVVRTDPAPGFQALVNDELLHNHRIAIEIGRIKNPNKNPVAERAVQELQQEILRLEPGQRTVDPLTLTLAVTNLNSRLRHMGLSARELFTQRDQFTNKQLNFSDPDLILAQNVNRNKNHPHSEKSKAPTGRLLSAPSLSVGDIVYLHRDRDKTRPRDRYLVVSVEHPWCNIRKFTGQQLRNASYRVKMTECYKVPSTYTPSYPSGALDDSDSDCSISDDSMIPVTHHQAPPTPPEIPVQISSPPMDTEYYPPPTSQPPPPSDLPLADPLVSAPNLSNVTDVRDRRSLRPRDKLKVPSHLKDFVI